MHGHVDRMRKQAEEQAEIVFRKVQEAGAIKVQHKAA